MTDDTSFYVQITPVTNEENQWIGELHVNIMTDKHNPLDRESYSSMMHLSEVVACSIAYMEQHPELIEDIENFIDSVDAEEVATFVKPEVEYTEGNVVKLSFGTKTKGSA